MATTWMVCLFVCSGHHDYCTIVFVSHFDFSKTNTSMRPLPGLVGQLPYEFGSLSAQLLYDLYSHGSLPSDRYKTKVIPLLPPDDITFERSQGGKLKHCCFTCYGAIAFAAFTSTTLTVLARFRGAMAVRVAKPLL